MAACKVEFTKSAAKEFERLPARIQDRLVEALKVLAENPGTELLQIKKLKGAAALYRIRISDYRLVYTIEKDKLLIVVIKVGHRKGVYRQL